MKQNIYITASEIGEFVYCPRGWWLRFYGHVSGSTEGMLEGTKQHEALAQGVGKHRFITSAALLLIGLGIVALILLFAYSWIISSQ